MNSRLLLLPLFFSCGVALPALDAGVGDVVVLDGGASIDAGAILDWPFPFAPNVTVVVDPSVQVEAETCAFSCSNTRQMLPPVVNACELGGVIASASGACMAGTCGAAETCMVDEFKFAQSYCAKSGRPRAYCWASRSADGTVSLSERVLHRLTGSVMVIRVREEQGTLVAQAFTHEGTDEVDDQGRPSPLPIALTPVRGTVTLGSSTLSVGAVVKGRYHVEFELPNIGPVVVDGTFSDSIR